MSEGYYVKPTILEGHNKMRVFQEEIFGPVVAVTKFKDEEEALSIANDTLYGLGAGVWSRDGTRAYRFGRAIQAGRVWTNCYHLYPAHAAFGGYKQSGIGRETHKMMLDITSRPRTSWSATAPRHWASSDRAAVTTLPAGPVGRAMPPRVARPPPFESRMMVPPRILATDAAVAVIDELRGPARTADVPPGRALLRRFRADVLSGGRVSRRGQDVLLGHVAGDVPVWIGAAQFEYWRHTQGNDRRRPRPRRGLLAGGSDGRRFIIRSRVFSDAEVDALDAAGPPQRGGD